MTETKFKVGDEVVHLGILGVIQEIKTGGYLVDYGASNESQHEGVVFVYESDLTKVGDQ